jgi:4-amino-4-deoxychorismate lyase
MSLFLETIKIQDGELQHPDLHLQRIHNTCLEYYGKKKHLGTMRDHLNLSAKNRLEKTKLTIRYDLDDQFFSSTAYAIKKIETLVLIEDNELDYHLKYTDRKILEKYARMAGLENEAVIIKNNRITDTTYANLALWNGSEWHTPLYPLLKGTKRQLLLQSNQIVEQDILVTDLMRYQKVSLINAMLELGELEIMIGRIRPLADMR